MCNKLLQLYACNHSKTICTTPCPHALETGRQVPLVSGIHALVRSDSTVSSLAPSNRHDYQPTQLRSHLAQTATPPAFRFVPPGQPSPSGPPPPGYRGHSPTSATPTLTTSPSFPRLPGEECTIEPNFCPYHFPRYLPKSQHPCKECYMLPEWQDLWMRWMKWYRQEHAVEKQEDVERLSGIKALRESHEKKTREGLLNVFVNGDESAGKIV